MKFLKIRMSNSLILGIVFLQFLVSAVESCEEAIEKKMKQREEDWRTNLKIGDKLQNYSLSEQTWYNARVIDFTMRKSRGFYMKCGGEIKKITREGARVESLYAVVQYTKDLGVGDKCNVRKGPNYPWLGGILERDCGGITWVVKPHNGDDKIAITHNLDNVQNQWKNVRLDDLLVEEVMQPLPELRKQWKQEIIAELLQEAARKKAEQNAIAKKHAEQKRIEEEKKAEQKRLEEERLAEEARQIALEEEEKRRAEEARLIIEKEEKRLADEAALLNECERNDLDRDLAKIVVVTGSKPQVSEAHKAEAANLFGETTTADDTAHFLEIKNSIACENKRTAEMLIKKLTTTQQNKVKSGKEKYYLDTDNLLANTPVEIEQEGAKAIWKYFMTRCQEVRKTRKQSFREKCALRGFTKEERSIIRRVVKEYGEDKMIHFFLQVVADSTIVEEGNVAILNQLKQKCSNKRRRLFDRLQGAFM